MRRENSVLHDNTDLLRVDIRACQLARVNASELRYEEGTGAGWRFYWFCTRTSLYAIQRNGKLLFGKNEMEWDEMGNYQKNSEYRKKNE